MGTSKETDPGPDRRDVADLESIQRAYETRLRRLVDELTVEYKADDEQRRHLLMLSSLATAVVRAYGAQWAVLGGDRLDPNISIMYASQASAGATLNVPLRSLVDDNCLSSWQARFLNSSVGVKRTILFSGLKDSGRSTLLNSLIQLISVDQRVVAVEGEDTLPVLRERAFTVRIPARPGTPSFVSALEKAAGMRPTWIVAQHLGGGDGPAFLRTLSAGFSGLATIDTPDPEVALSEWIAHNTQAALHLNKLAPLVVHMGHDKGGRPRLLRILEAGLREDGNALKLVERRPD